MTDLRGGPADTSDEAVEPRGVLAEEDWQPLLPEDAADASDEDEVVIPDDDDPNAVVDPSELPDEVRDGDIGATEPEEI